MVRIARAETGRRARLEVVRITFISPFTLTLPHAAIFYDDCGDDNCGASLQ
jgi:hypothetical protein